MTRFMTIKKPLLMSAILLVFSSHIFADEQWYQVELIVFKRLSHNQTELAIDPNRLDLSYPAKQAFVIDASSLNNEGKTLSPDTQLLVELNQEQQLLKSQARSLQLNRNHQVLFHKSWNQQLGPRNNTEAVVITGGERYDDHQELEGYVQLSKARYLHINANLWLSRFSPNISGELGNWPHLPAVPQQVWQDKQSNFGADSNYRFDPDQTLEADTFDSLRADSEDATRPEPHMLQQELMNRDLAQREQQIASGYHVNEIQRIQQHRRMRSKEIHYIDHPAFGIIVKLIPVTAPAWPFNNKAKVIVVDTVEKEERVEAPLSDVTPAQGELKSPQ